MDGGAVFGVIGGEEGQGLLEPVQGSVEVGQEHRPGFPGVAGFVEPLVGEDAQASQGFGAAEGVVVGPVGEAVLIPALSLAQVPHARDGHVGVAEAARQVGFLGAGADLLVQAEGFLVVGQAARIALEAEDVAEVFQGDGEGVDLVALEGGELAGGGGQGGSGPVPGPGDEGLLEAGGGGPVPRGHGQPDPVFGDEVPLVLAAGQRAVGGRVDELRGDLLDEAGPFPVAARPLIQDAQALQAAEGIRPVLGRPGQGQGVQQVGFLSPQRWDRVTRAVGVLVEVVAAEPGEGMGVGAGRLAGRGGWRAVRRR